MVCRAITRGLNVLPDLEMELQAPDPMVDARKYLRDSWRAQAQKAQVLNYIKTCHASDRSNKLTPGCFKDGSHCQ